MHDVVFRLAIAVILAAAIIYLMATSFSRIGEASNTTIGGLEEARRNSLSHSVSYLQR